MRQEVRDLAFASLFSPLFLFYHNSVVISNLHLAIKVNEMLISPQI